MLSTAYQWVGIGSFFSVQLGEGYPKGSSLADYTKGMWVYRGFLLVWNKFFEIWLTFFTLASGQYCYLVLWQVSFSEKFQVNCTEDIESAGTDFGAGVGVGVDTWALT